MVEPIEEFASKLKPMCLAQIDILVHCEIQVFKRITSQNIPSGIAKCELIRSDETARIEPLMDSRIVNPSVADSNWSRAETSV